MKWASITQLLLIHLSVLLKLVFNIKLSNKNGILQNNKLCLHFETLVAKFNTKITQITFPTCSLILDLTFEIVYTAPFLACCAQMFWKCYNTFVFGEKAP